MPYVIRPIRRLRAVCVAALIAGFLLPAAAQASSCPSQSTSHPFSRWGDNNNYSLLSGGSFESGTSGWSLSRASVVAGNESYKVRSSGDSHSLSIDSSGSAVSPSFCVGVEHPGFRFFARQTSGRWADLDVKLRWTDYDGDTRETRVGDLDGDDFGSWSPTGSMPLAGSLPVWNDKTLNVRLVFDPDRRGGDWTIDDVYIDPYRR